MANKKYLNKILDAAASESDAFMKSGKGTNTSNFVPMKGDMAANPDRKYGSGFADSYGEKAKLLFKNNPREMTPKQISDFISQHAAGNHGAKLDDFSSGLRVKNPDGMSAGKPQRPQNLREIPESQGGTMPDYVTNGKKKFTGFTLDDEPNAMNKPFNPKEYYKGGNMSIKPTNIGKKNPFSLSDDDFAIGATGATGFALGEGINSAMDESHKQGMKSQSDAHSYWTRKKSGQ